MKKIEFITNKPDRVLKLLEKQYPNVLYSAFVKALRQKDVLINGKRIKENTPVIQGSKITVFIENDTEKNNMFKTVYEDSNIIVINKNKGIETCDGDYNIVNELYKQNLIVYPVHRLDRNTLGLVIFAKSQEVQNALIEEFKSGNVEKYYYAEVYGVPNQKKTTLRGYLVKNKNESNVMIYDKQIQGAVPITTEFAVLKSNGNTSLLSVKIKDGKTHQIRAHLAYHNLPIIGDGKYGKNEINTKFKSKTQHLKAYKILFNIQNNRALTYLNNLNLELDDRFWQMLLFGNDLSWQKKIKQLKFIYVF